VLIAIGLALIVALTVATAYFVAAEFAYVAVDRSKLRRAADSGDRAAARAAGITGRLSFMLSGAQLGITVTALLGATFVGGQVYEFTSFYHEGLGFTTSLFSSSLYTLTGFHGVHVSVGVVMLLSTAGILSRSKVPGDKAEVVELVGLYWHFVDIVWIVIFTLVYLIPA